MSLDPRIGGASSAAQGAPSARAAAFPLPSPHEMLTQLYRVSFVGLFVFGYGLSITFGALTWLFNEQQWRWTYVMYATLVPVFGGGSLIAVPYLLYRPIQKTLKEWAGGALVDRQRCVTVYQLSLRMPWRVGFGVFVAVFTAYPVGLYILYEVANVPMTEVVKMLPAMPLVAGLTGAFSYFGTSRVLQPLLAWCSAQLRYARPIHRVPLAVKFLATTCILVIATLCLLQPAAYTLGQVVTERHLAERVVAQLQATVYRLEQFTQPADQWAILQQAAVGKHGYAFAIDREGQILSPHPRGFTHVSKERFFQLQEHLRGETGVWVDRVDQHRVVAFVNTVDPPQTYLSVASPADFSRPLQQFVRFSWFVILEVLLLVVLFGRYFTKGITTPLAKLTHAARRVAEQGDLSQHVPVTTDDELSEVARSFNHMVEQLQLSQARLEAYTRQLERSTQELLALNQEMEDLLRVVSHDLRAPLINIQGFSKRLEPVMQETFRALDRLAAAAPAGGQRQALEQLRNQVQTQFAQSLQFISKGVERMDVLLSSLLAVSRVGRKADPMRMNDLNEILNETLAVFDHQLKERAIEIVQHPLPRQVPCRRNETSQVFSNLLSNAINYMGPTGGRFIEIGATERPEEVECFIRDTGVGIDPDDHERIFQMFTRLHAVEVLGEGVGLAYVRKILRSHGGRIWVTSQRGGGSTFFFTLPMRQPASALLEPPVQEEAAARTVGG